MDSKDKTTVETKASESPPPSEIVVLAADAKGRQIVSVHVKRSYRLLLDGQCQRGPSPIPLLFAREPEGDDPGVPESDVMPIKTSTDLIVMARAYPRPGESVATAGIRVGDITRRMLVFGPRKCIYDGPGTFRFSKPERFDNVFLSYDNAYGGVDPTVPVPEKIQVQDLFKLPAYAYPRNTVGKGYAIHDNPQRIDGMDLPQIENPDDLLTPSRLVVGNPRDWWRQPFPWGCGWFDGMWYPRSSFYGVLPEGVPDDDAQMMEVRSGWLRKGQIRRFRETAPTSRLDGRFLDAASPGLVLPFLRGDEPIRLESVLPGGQSIVVRLPSERPRILLRFLGKVHEVVPVVNRVLVSTIEMGVYVVWHGAWHPTQPLPVRHPTTSEPSVPDLDGVEAYADGTKVLSYDEWEAASAKA